LNDFKERLIQLLHYPKITWNTVFSLLKKDPSLSSLFQLQPNDFQSCKPFPPLNAFQNSPQNNRLFESIHEQIRQYETNGIQVTTFVDKEYPSLLKQIYQPPWALFSKGDLSLLEMEPKLAVVGSRQATAYGKSAINFIFPGLLSKGVVIVSGLARGIDKISHETAIDHNGKTIAVIAGGLYHIYPKENEELAFRLMKNQLIVSEYPPDTRPERWHFPMRNRIISGLAAGTLIIEAKQKSGSLITANYAVNEGREVFALPGSIFNHCSNGTNELIQQGAKLVMNAEDILEEIRA
jgi:DNA processing protein